jgi:deoxyhypusine monooxygenase
MASADVIQPSAEKYDQMEALLCNTSGNVPLSERFRILFTLKNIADDRSIEIIGKGNWSYHEILQHTRIILMVFALQL